MLKELLSNLSLALRANPGKALLAVALSVACFYLGWSGRGCVQDLRTADQATIPQKTVKCRDLPGLRQAK